MKQYTLTQPTPNGVKHLTTWLEKHKDLQVGSLLSLKDVPGKWKIEKVYEHEHDDNAFTWQRKWTNNI